MVEEEAEAEAGTDFKSNSSASGKCMDENRACTNFPLAVLNAQTGGQFLLNASMGLNFAAFLAG